MYGASLRGGTGGGTVFAINPDGSGFKVLHDFGSSANDATNLGSPRWCSALMVASVDGISGGGSNGVGAIFTLLRDGTGYKVLYSFGGVAQDGMWPGVPLVQSADGTLHGVTSSGGATNMGTVFALRPDGTAYRLLHVFQGSPDDGARPLSGLTLGKDGVLYGATLSGGTNTSRPVGTVFKLNADGLGFTLLHSFGNGANGVNPRGVLFQGKDGALYGTAGIVFRLNPDGSGFLVLSTLNNLGLPESGVVQGTDGSLTASCPASVSRLLATGPSKVNPDGTGYAVVHAFGTFIGDGCT